MATIKQIKVGSTTYDIKAEYDGDGNTIGSYYVKKSGDTMTGDLFVRHTDAGSDITSGDLTSTYSSYVGSHGLSGKIYLVATGTATGNKALSVMNNAGSYNDILRINQDNNISLVRPIVGDIQHIGNHYVHPNFQLNSGTAGFILICTITINSGQTYGDMPITLKIVQRGLARATNLSLLLTTTNSGATHDINQFTGDYNYEPYYVYKSASNTFQIIARKNGNYASMAVLDYGTGSYMTSRCTVVWNNTFLSSLPSGSIQATGSTYLPLSGGTLTGPLVITGNAADTPLRTRGIDGSNGTGGAGDLYLNYHGGVTYFGTSGGATISADGKTYSGNAYSVTNVYSRNTVGDLGWGTSANHTKIPNISCLAFWNGAYNGSSSNLAYCAKGAFGTGATKNISHGTGTPSGGSNGDIYIQHA